jgi:hypothetical protein
MKAFKKQNVKNEYKIIDFSAPDQRKSALCGIINVSGI